jgi:hypothetical protein
MLLEEMANSANEIDTADGIGNSGIAGKFLQEGPLQGSTGRGCRWKLRKLLPAVVLASVCAILTSPIDWDAGAWESQSPHDANEKSTMQRRDAVATDAVKDSTYGRKATDATLFHKIKRSPD